MVTWSQQDMQVKNLSWLQINRQQEALIWTGPRTTCLTSRAATSSTWTSSFATLPFPIWSSASWARWTSAWSTSVARSRRLGLISAFSRFSNWYRLRAISLKTVAVMSAHPETTKIQLELSVHCRSKACDSHLNFLIRMPCNESLRTLTIQCRLPAKKGNCPLVSSLCRVSRRKALSPSRIHTWRWRKAQSSRKVCRMSCFATTWEKGDTN